MADHEVRPLRPGVAGPLEDAQAAVVAVGHTLEGKPDRREVLRTAIASGIVGAIAAVLIAVPLSIAGARTQARTDASQDARAAALEQSQKEDRARADDAYSAAQEANAELKRRGQEPVPVPKPEGTDSAQDTLVAAAVAGTLAALPKTSRGPSAAELGRAVATYMASNPAPGPSARQIAAAVAAWLQAHPPADGTDGRDGQDGPTGPGGPTGPTGPQGPAGPAPTAEEIQAAVAAELADNPGVLCTSTGGTWTRLDNVVIDADPSVTLDATTATVWACVQ